MQTHFVHPRAGVYLPMSINDEGFTLHAPVTSRDHRRGGDNSASIIVVEYGDYTDAMSRAAHAECERLCRHFGDSICFVYRHFPRSHFEPQAAKAAEAAEAAGAQGRFWQMHECLYRQAGAPDNAGLVECAVEIGLDVGRFLLDMSESKHADKVRSDYLGAVKSGVAKSPVFFVGGERYKGANDFNSLRAAVERAAGAGG